MIDPFHVINHALLAWYPIDERTGTVVRDLSPFRNHGTVQGGTWGVDEMGAHLDLNGSSDWVDLGAASHLDSQRNSISISFISRHDNASATVRWVQKRGTGAFGAQDGWQVSRTSSGSWGNIGIDDGSNYMQITANGNLDTIFPTGTPHRVTVVLDPRNDEIDVWAGFGVGSHTAARTGGSIDIVDTTRNATLGCAWNDASTRSQYLDGTIADVRIWGRKLTRQEHLLLLSDRYAGLKK